MLKIFSVIAVLCARQCGKTTLAKQVRCEHYFDLENPRDLARLNNPQLVLENLKGLVVIDEIQLVQDLFPLTHRRLTKSMQIAVGDLELAHLWVIYPGQQVYPLEKNITTLPLK